MGTACHVRGAPRILEAIERGLKIQAGETTKDLQYTLETVNCVGACALGPVVVVDGEAKGKLNPQRAERLLKQIEPEAAPKKTAVKTSPAKAKKKVAAPKKKAPARKAASAAKKASKPKTKSTAKKTVSAKPKPAAKGTAKKRTAKKARI